MYRLCIRLKIDIQFNSQNLFNCVEFILLGHQQVLVDKIKSTVAKTLFSVIKRQFMELVKW